MAKNKKFNRNGKQEAFGKQSGKPKAKRPNVSKPKVEYKAENEQKDTASKGLPKGANHIDWYNKVPNLYEPAFAAATMPALGYNYKSSLTSNQCVTVDDTAHQVAGIMSFQYAPLVGTATGPESPINRVAMAMWKRFRTGLTSNGWYEPADLMMYILAADSIYMMINYLIRIYGVATWYDSRNRFVPDSLLHMMNVSPDDVMVKQYLPSFRMRINKLIMRMSSYHIPKGFDVITRHSWLSANIFKDCDKELSQLYLFIPAGYYMADMDTNPAPYELGPKLKYIDLGGYKAPGSLTSNRISGLLNQVDTLISRLGSVFDAIRLSAEVDRVFGSDVHVMSEIPEDYTVGPIYNEDILAQIRNITMMPETFTPVDVVQMVDSLEDIDQTSYITQNFLSYLDNPGLGMLAGVPIVDLHQDSPTRDDLCYATRFMAKAVFTGLHETAQTPTYDLISGTEVVTRCAIALPSDPSSSVVAYQYPFKTVEFNHVYDSTTVQFDSSELKDLHFLKQFDNCPSWRLFKQLYTGTDYPENGNLYRLDLDMAVRHNTAILTDEALANMHEAVVYSLYNFPLIGG